MDDVETAIAALVGGIASSRRDLEDNDANTNLAQIYEPFLKVENSLIQYS
jgi:hypothetical protein